MTNTGWKTIRVAVSISSRRQCSVMGFASATACKKGVVETETLETLRESPATARAKAKFVLATDGVGFQAEDLMSGDAVACDYVRFPDHLGFFLGPAGINTVRQIRRSAFENDGDLEEQINALAAEMNHAADLRNGFIECDFSEVGTDRSW